MEVGSLLSPCTAESPNSIGIIVQREDGQVRLGMWLASTDNLISVVVAVIKDGIMTSCSRGCEPGENGSLNGQG